MIEKLTKERVLDIIRNSHTAIISMNNGTMTTRVVSILLHDKKIWFQTDLRSKKMKGLDKNDKCKCSLLVDNLNMDGAILETKGHPFDTTNSEWLHEFEKHHPNTVKMYSRINTEVLCCIDINNISEIRMWEYDENYNPFIHTIKITEDNVWNDIILNGYTYSIASIAN